MSKYRNKIVKKITLEILQEYSKKILAGILSREQVARDSDKLLELYNKNELDYPTSEKYYIFDELCFLLEIDTKQSSRYKYDDEVILTHLESTTNKTLITPRQVKIILENILHDKAKREEASNWAMDIMRKSDEKMLEYYPRDSHSILNEMLDFIGGIDIKVFAKRYSQEYLYDDSVIASYLEKLTKMANLSVR